MKTMTDAMGQAVPVKYVSKWDRERDAAVRRIFAKWMKARAGLEKTVSECYKELMALAGKRDKSIAAKGNFQARSFDALICVSMDQQYRILLDDRVKTARDMMLAYAKSLCEKAGEDAAALLEIVEEAFQATSNGSLSVARVLSLCRKEIKAAVWREARELLLSSIQPVKGKIYLRVERRESTQDNFRLIRLDSSDCPL